MTRSLLALVLLLGSASSPLAAKTAATKATAAASLKQSLPEALAAQKLAAVKQEVQRLVRAGRSPVVVFDIDDTLVHNGRFTPKAEIGTPEAGAPGYVHELSGAGATVVYLTGRKLHEQAATTQVLKKARLPIGSKQVLLLNPDPKMNALDWKQSATPEIKKLGTVVALFDNELANVRMFRKEYPRSQVFRLNTSSDKPDPGGRGTIFVIKDFLGTAQP